MTPADTCVEDAPAVPPPASRAALVASVRSVLTAAVAPPAIAELELHAPQDPELSMTVRRSERHLQEFVVWPTPVPTGASEPELVLTAVAGDAGRECRDHVRNAAALIGELVAADRRVRHAETVAAQAIELAGVDPLTQLGNLRAWRRALSEESSRASRHRSTTSVLVVDLDGLKRVNDEHGHAAGDALLQRAAASLRSTSRSIDVTCRLGGDEFALLAPHTDADGAAALVARLRETLHQAGVEASIGAASTAEGDLHEVWRLADLAMYDDKRARAVSARTVLSGR